ncbi:MAG: hypothetical protein ACK4L7_03870, partial [Flavobacteriales bacterium]
MTPQRTGLLAALAAILLPLLAGAQVITLPAERILRASKAEVTCLAASPKGDRLLAGLSKGAELIDLESGKKLLTLPYNEDGSSAVY